MKLNEWRSRGEEKQLPSGLTVKLKRAGLLDLVAGGRIPQPLVGVVNELLNEEAGKSLTTVDDFVEIMPLVDNMAKICIIDPPVADEPDEEHLGVSELPIVDRLYIWNWAMGRPVDILRPFPGEPDGSAGPGGGSDGLQDPPVADPGD